MTPAAAVEAIRDGADRRSKGDLEEALLKVPEYSLEIVYGDPVHPYRMGWYPGAGHRKPRLRFKTADYFDVLRMLNFVT